VNAGPLLALAGSAVLAATAAAPRAPRAWLAAVLVGTIAALGASVAVLAAGGGWEWRGAPTLGGDVVHLRLDAISALFLALLSVLGGAGAAYSREYWTDREHPRSATTGRFCWSALLLTMGLVLLAGNGLHFLIAWELFAVTAYFLISLDRQNAPARASGRLYLVASHAGTLALFAFFATAAARTGTWDLQAMRGRADLAPLFWLALFGFGLKAGVFPLHVWLPSAHANAPSHVSAMMSGIAIKMGIYGLVRFGGYLPPAPGAGWAVAALGVASAVLGVVFALAQHDLKRLLAYHSVENIGIILIGLGFAMVAVDAGSPEWGRLALAGGLLHVWNHGLFKALLFFGAGAVLHGTGTRDMSRLGGLWRSMPWTASLFALGAAAISGLPPLNGFVSEWLILMGLFDASITRGAIGWGSIPAAILLGMTGALALACFVKVCGVVFLGAPRSDAAARAREHPGPMRGAMILLAAACVAIGLGPVAFWPAIARAVGAWHPAWGIASPPAPLLALGTAHALLAGLALAAAWGLAQRCRAGGARRAPTWDCGYSAPSARMQYTAGSFARIINGWFRGILRPEQRRFVPEGPFPATASSVEHTPETVLELLVEPAGRLVLRCSAAVRRLQHGRVQTYVIYLAIGLAGLAALVVSGGAP
jgi:hydrogenase-4 component B